MAYSWIPIIGYFTFDEETISYFGGTTQPEPNQQSDDNQASDEQNIDEIHLLDEPEKTFFSSGLAICDQRFAGGSISADVEFSSDVEGSACEFIIYYNPSIDNYVTAGIGGSAQSMFSVRQYSSGSWYVHAQKGEKGNLQIDTPYHLTVTLKGSRVSINVNGVDVLTTILPFYLPPSQVGLWCQTQLYIDISNYIVRSETAKAFVVMQFSTPYNELYMDVIKKVCGEFNIEAVRADETYGPGIIIADIEKQIDESKFVIADITPTNPNVYYEVGYSHALNKPTILIAENPTKLPFDVSPFRTLFYENSIAGKNKIEEGLRNHIRAILTDLKLR